MKLCMYVGYHDANNVSNFGGDLLDLRALLGFERRQSASKGLPLGSVKDHLGSIGGVEASRIEIVLD